MAGDTNTVTRERSRQLALMAVATGVAYYAAARIGLALTPSSEAVSTLWPPNAVLLGALLLAPLEWWLALILAAFPAHLIVEVQGGVPLGMVLSWYVSNCAEAFIGAACIRYLIRRPVRFDSFTRVAIFVGFGAFLAPFLTSFLDIGFIRLNDWHSSTDYWTLWRGRFFSNALAILTLVPAIVPWDIQTLKAIRVTRTARLAEGAVLGVGLLLVCTLGVWREPALPLTAHILLFVPLPFLLWAAVRFGPGGAGACLLTFSVLTIWGVVHGEGPFVGPAADNILSIQLYLIVTYIPILVLSAVIRERTHAESLARRNEERLNLVLGAAQMGTWDLDISSGRTTLCGRSREIFGLADAPCEIGWSTFSDSLGDADRDRVEAATTRAIQDDEPYEVEVQVGAPDFPRRWVLSKGSVVRDPHGRPLRMLGIHVDITERKQAEAALREEAALRALREELEQRVAERTAELSLINRVLLEEIDVRERIGRALRASEERFAKAFRASPDAMSIIRRADARLIEVNERWVAMFGFSREEAIGQTLQSLGISPRDSNHRDGLGPLSSPQGSVRDAEVELHNRRGEALYALVTSETVEVAGEQCLIAMIRDVTERRRAEHEVVAQRRQLAHLGRVALLGELSGALAHELNQPLAAILANARAGQRMLFRDELDRVELSRILEDIAADDRRAGSVIHRVRAMLRQGETEPQRVVANDLIAEVLDLAHSDLIQRSVTVTTRLDPSLPSVAADRVQLQQVLLNLIVNACDAMGDNAPTDRHIWIATANEGAAIRVSVSDCGAGITRHPVDSVFEAFITSKAHGLGLGLSICRSIVDGHGGRMWASNNEDRGATFTFLLPRTEVALEVPPVWRAPELMGTAR